MEKRPITRNDLITQINEYEQAAEQGRHNWMANAGAAQALKNLLETLPQDEAPPRVIEGEVVSSE